MSLCVPVVREIAVESFNFYRNLSFSRSLWNFLNGNRFKSCANYFHFFCSMNVFKLYFSWVYTGARLWDCDGDRSNGTCRVRICSFFLPENSPLKIWDDDMLVYTYLSGKRWRTPSLNIVSHILLIIQSSLRVDVSMITKSSLIFDATSFVLFWFLFFLLLILNFVIAFS